MPVAAVVHGHHTVSRLAFAQDCIHWAVVAFVASYLIWLALHRRHQPVPEHPADADLIAQPSH